MFVYEWLMVRFRKVISLLSYLCVDCWKEKEESGSGYEWEWGEEWIDE
jgi:hypothetical protein